MKIDLEFTSGRKTVSIHIGQNSPCFQSEGVTNKVRSHEDRTLHKRQRKEQKEGLHVPKSES